MKMSRQFPLNALRVFEAAARHLSFTKAGEDLGMTQTAVSYQIKLLENHVGEQLFARKPRQVTLTESGERLAASVSQAFGILETAVAEVRKGSEEVLVVHVTATFAQQWLARRIGVFQLRYPKIAVHLVLSNHLVDFSRENVDVAIRWGTGNWPDLISHRIMRLDFAPVLSADLAQSIGGVHKPADLLKLPLVSPTDPWWKQWFREAGVENPDLDTRTASSFGIQNLDAQTAMAGHGVAIVNPDHYAEDIAAGRLLVPFDLRCNDGRDYWLAYAQSRRNVPKIRAFSQWMLEEFAPVPD